MNENGENAYGVTYGRITFLQKIILGNDNVSSCERHDDLAFTVNRTAQSDTIEVICVDEYALSEARAREVLSDFPNANIIFVGGKWNHPTREALKYCRAKKVGICNAGNVNAALSKTQYWR